MTSAGHYIYQDAAILLHFSPLPDRSTYDLKFTKHATTHVEGAQHK